jgi:hypothetical protein
VIEALRNGTVDVSIYDTPMQRHVERREAATAAGLGLPAPFVTVGEPFEDQDYAMVVDPHNTEILNMLNLAIVATDSTPEYDELNVRYFASPFTEGGFNDSVGNLEVSSIAAAWGGGVLVLTILFFVILYRIRHACQVGACQRGASLPATRPHRTILQARDAVIRTQTFLNAFSGRGHHFDAKIAEMERQANEQDRYLDDIEANRVGMKCSRDTSIKMMRLLDIVAGIQRQLDETRAKTAPASPSAVVLVEDDGPTPATGPSFEVRSGGAVDSPQDPEV